MLHLINMGINSYLETPASIRKPFFWCFQVMVVQAVNWCPEY